MAKKAIEPTITYRIWYKLNPEYAGTWQKDKIGGGGLHATVNAQMGGLQRAQEEAGRCKTWFNDEKIAVEKSAPNGKKIVEVKTTRHDNVIVWIERLKDGYAEDEEVKGIVQKPIETPVPSDGDRIKALEDRIDELTKLLAKSLASKGVVEEDEEVEELAGV
jgi:hypothetical protein